MELPDELWKIVKDYQIDHKKHHKRNMEPCLEYIDGLYSEVYLYSSVFPSLQYREGEEVDFGENDGLWVPLQNLPVTVVGRNLKGRQKWWYGFGWVRKRDENIFKKKIPR
jgi:hypothetical protein